MCVGSSAADLFGSITSFAHSCNGRSGQIAAVGRPTRRATSRSEEYSIYQTKSAADLRSRAGRSGSTEYYRAPSLELSSRSCPAKTSNRSLPAVDCHGICVSMCPPSPRFINLSGDFGACRNGGPARGSNLPDRRRATARARRRRTRRCWRGWVSSHSLISAPHSTGGQLPILLQSISGPVAFVSFRRPI
jgi:hypothetical protein